MGGLRKKKELAETEKKGTALTTKRKQKRVRLPQTKREKGFFFSCLSVSG